MKTASNIRSGWGKSILLGVGGIVAGGWFGYWIFHWLLSYGLYGLAIPGAFVGIGLSVAVRRKSFALAIIAAVLSFVWGLYCEWSAFARNASLGEFLANLTQTEPITWVMLLVGAAVSFSFFVGPER